MPSLSKPAWTRLGRIGLTLLLLAAIFRSAAEIGTWFLPVTPLSYRADPPPPPFRTYRFSQALALEKEKAPEAKSQPRQAQPVYRITDLVLAAVYAEEGGNGFILVKDKQESLILGRGESHKGYLLTAVFPKKAVFEKDGRRFELVLEEEKNAKLDAITPVAAPEKEAEQTMERVSRDEIRRYRTNMNLIWKDIHIRPLNQGADGFEVTYVRSGSVFEQLGLQAKDILKEANGIELKSIKDALALYKRVDTMQAFKLRILRNGAEKELEYEIY